MIKMNNNSSRTDWIDVAKAIGIVLVVYGHVARGAYSGGLIRTEKVYLLVDSIIYSFHMPLFFFLSGLFFYNSLNKSGAKVLLLKKVDTILYPYVLWSLLQGLIEVLLSNYTNGDASFHDVLALWVPRAQFWFLYALFFVFVFSVALHSFFSEKHLPFLLLLTAFFYLAPIDSYVTTNSILKYVADNIFFFFLGMTFSTYAWQSFFRLRFTLIVTTLFFIASQYFYHFYFNKSFEDRDILTLIVGIIAILFIISLSSFLLRFPSRWLIYIGSSSMAIYLMHILAGSGVRVLLKNLLSIESPYIHLIFGTCVGIFLPLLVLEILKFLNIRYFFSAPISRLFLNNKKR